MPTTSLAEKHDEESPLAGTMSQAELRRKLRQAGKLRREKQRLDERMRGFTVDDSVSWRGLCYHFQTPKLNHTELISIATLVAQVANIKLDRDAKRRKSVLLKWFEENWSAIYPNLGYIALEDPGD